MSRRGTAPSAYPVQRIRSGPRWFGYAHHSSWSARERVARYCCPVSCAVLCSLPNACPCSWTSRESSTMGARGATERKYRRSAGGHASREKEAQRNPEGPDTSGTEGTAARQGLGHRRALTYRFSALRRGLSPADSKSTSQTRRSCRQPTPKFPVKSTN